MQEILRKEAVATVSTKSVVHRERRQAGVGVDVTSRVRPEALQLLARRGGQLDLRIPVDINVKPVIPDQVKAGVTYDGCGSTRFFVTMPFVPSFTQHGALQFRPGKVTARNNGFRCRIFTTLAGDAYGAMKNLGKTLEGVFSGRGVEKLADVDVTASIRKEMIRLGRKALAGRIKQVNARLPTGQALQGLLRQPAAFGSAISLGIDQPRVRLSGVQVTGDSYDLLGSLEGYPRLRFGKDWADAPDLPAMSNVGDGFRVPARLMFPTDERLLPDATLTKASGCLGVFRLRPVAGRDDLAVLQRCDVSETRNVIWLSGDRTAPPDTANAFERPMSNFLDEILSWLEEPELWRGVAGVKDLRREVAAFRQLVERFQADTTLPIQDRGSLSFRDLGIDLHRLWVTDEAILADVSLVGKATLQLDLMP